MSGAPDGARTAAAVPLLFPSGNRTLCPAEHDVPNSLIGGGPSTARKPGSVPPVARGRWPSIWDAGLPAPLATATRGLGEQPIAPAARRAWRPPIWSCSERGLPGRPVTRPPVGSYPTISPLPARGRRCHFCGTFLRVTPTGRYPAPCSSEPGLSSPPHDRGGAVTRPPRPKAILPRPELQQTASSMALLARASAPRFRSLGTWRTMTRGNECNNPVAWRWSGASSLSRTL